MEFVSKRFEELSAGEVYEILRARAEIFVAQQKICCADPDGLDKSCVHCYLTEGGRLIAYLRAHITEDGGAIKVGRVLTMTHGLGHGRTLMEMSIPAVKEAFALDEIVVNAQCHAMGFYEKLGFSVTSDEFMEEGVPHVEMRLK